jgi:hypothetical protein
MATGALIAALRRIPYPRTVATVLGVWFLYLALGLFLAPRLIERAIPEMAAEHLQRKASVGAVRVNPLLFRVLVRDLALAEQDGTLIVGFKRLLVDLELSSIVRWAWTFSSIRLDGLDLRVDIRPDGTLNLAALAAPAAGEKVESHGDKAPPRLLLQHALLRGGAITFTDRTGSAPASVTLQPLDLELRDVSTLPDPRGPYTVSASLRDGGTLRWRGDVSLHPIHSRGEIEAHRLRVATAWQFLRDRFDLAEPAGTVDASARYRFEYFGSTPQLTIEDLRIAATGIALAETAARDAALKLDAIEVTGGRFDLVAQELVLPKLEVRNGLVAAEADAGGMLNWQRIVKSPPVARSAPEPAPEGRPWKIIIESAHAGGVALRYVDRSRAAPLQLGVAGLDVAFSADVDAGGGRTQALVNRLALQLDKVTFGEMDAAAPIAAIAAVSVVGGSADLEQRRILVERAAVSGGSVRIARGANGRLRVLDVLTVVDANRSQQEVAPITRAAIGKEAAWRATLDVFEVGGVRVALADEGTEPALEYDLDVARVTARNVSTDGKTPIEFDAALRIVQGGDVRAAGEIRDLGGRVAGTVKVERLALKPLAPLVARDTNLRLDSGDVSANAKMEFRAGKERPELRVAGSAGIRDLLLTESVGGERLLAWKAVEASGIAFSLEPDRLTVEDVRLVEPGAKIAIFKDRSLNLANVMKPRPAGSAPAAKPAGPAAPAPAMDVAVDRVRVENGAVDFSDLSLVLPFGARIEEFNGTVTGISTDPAGAAALRLEGKEGEFGLARVDGTLKPFQPKAHTAIGVVFRNVELVPLSPYTATFAGRRIATGRVSLDLQYKVENSQLAGENSVVLERFALGEQVESPGALKLPYDLAIALLTDSDGRINVAVPVKGNVDDPQFSYGHLIWQAVATVIRNIVTAPFRALAGLFGSGAESLENIAFDAGRDVLQPPEREKLRRVADGIAKRPQLVLVVEGQAGEADLAALRERDVASAIAGKLGRAPAPGGVPEPVNALDARAQRAMETLFAERNSGEALSKFVAEIEKTRGKPVDRVNPVLALAGRASADTAFYEALLRRLNETARVPDEALPRLADARARAITAYMRESLSVPESRLSVRAAAEPGGNLAKLSFDVAKQKPQASRPGPIAQRD